MLLVPIENDIRVNFVRADQQIVLQAGVCDPLQFFATQYPPDGIVGVTEQETPSSLSRQLPQMLEIRLPTAIDDIIPQAQQLSIGIFRRLDR